MEKRNIEYYMSLNYPFKIETIKNEDGGGFLISYSDLAGCISDGETIEETLINGEDAKLAWITSALEESLEIPLPDTELEKFSGRITLRAPRSLHKELVDQAEREGVSLNQYIVYRLSKEDYKNLG